MSQTKIEKIDNTLNPIKTTTMQCLNTLYQALNEESNDIKLKSEFKEIEPLIVKGCIATLLDASRNHDFD